MTKTVDHIQLKWSKEAHPAALHSISVLLIAALLCPAGVQSQAVRWRLPRPPHHWADSMFVGADLVVPDSTREVTVRWLASCTGVEGTLALVDTSQPDLIRRIPTGPLDSSAVAIGHFPAGTRLVFRYNVSDTSQLAQPYSGTSAYSGPNRRVIDEPFVSEGPPTRYGQRRCVVGSLDSATAIIGFDDIGSGAYCGAIFVVTGVHLLRRE